jgi:uroporphyrinogen-III synthase
VSELSHWRLLLTRPAEECALLAATLAEQGVFSSSLPLLSIEPLAETPEQRRLVLELDRLRAVIVVSKPAARLGLERIKALWPQPPAALRWFSVGAATGQILSDHGLKVQYPLMGDDSEALLAVPEFAELLHEPGARVLIMRGDEGRELLAERLRQAGAQVDYLPLYRRGLPQYPAGELPRRIQAERLNGLVVSSGQGLQHLLQLAGEAWPELAGLTLLVPSPRVAEMARAAGARHVVDCRGASAAALLAALREPGAVIAP